MAEGLEGGGVGKAWRLHSLKVFLERKKRELQAASAGIVQGEGPQVHTLKARMSEPETEVKRT